ncbi:hypothetical protein LINPERHAP2_LOCUS7845 [Linum perenne]
MSIAELKLSGCVLPSKGAVGGAGWLAAAVRCLCEAAAAGVGGSRRRGCLWDYFVREWN